MRVFCLSGLLAMLAAGAGAFDFQTETPVRFEFTYLSAMGNTNACCGTGWIPTYVPPGDLQLYYAEGNVPYAFSANARLVLACNRADVWPGNTFACRAWLMPAATNDPPSHLSSNYGFEFGFLYRPWFTDHTAGFTKDFRSAFDNDGLFPLGTSLLGAMDSINFASLPVDELLEGGGAAAKALEGVLNVADAAGGNVCAIDIATEGVIEGTSVRVNIGGTDLVFTNLGPSGARDFTCYIPISAVQDGQPFYTLACLPRLIYNFYQGVGMQLTLVSPLSITLAPGILDRAGSLTGLGHYEPPSPALLHSTAYQCPRAGDAVPASAELTFALPLNQTPPKPDLVTSDLRSVDAAGRDVNTVDLYASELSALRFSICNGGATSTVLASDFICNVIVDGVAVVSNRVLCHLGAPAFTLAPGQSTNITFSWNFTEGAHAITYSSGYLELAGYDNGNPVYTLGDCNPYNNMKTRSVWVKPARGTVAGYVRANPDTFDTEAWTTNVLVRLTGPGLARTFRSGTEPFPNAGRYAFTNVPAGDYMLEILPSPSNSPAFVPRSMTFHHDAATGTDFSSASFAILRQMQRLRTAVLTAGMQPISNAVVTIRPLDLRRAVTGTNGVFEIADLGPISCNTLRIEHPLYHPRTIAVAFNVSDSCTSLQSLHGFTDMATTQWVEAAHIELAPDTTPPRLTVDPLPAPTVYSNSLTCRFAADDLLDERPADTFRYRIRSHGGIYDLTTGAWLSYTNAAGTNAQVALTVSLSGLAEGSLDLFLDVRDPASNTTTSAAMNFTHDSCAPGFTVAVAGGASVVTGRTASVTVTITNTESGPLTAEFSNNGTTWSASYAVTSSVFTLPDWPLTTSTTTHLAVTVRVRVHDLAGNLGTGSDDVTVDNSGAVTLAGGAPYATSRTVPLGIDITPPRGSVIYDEPELKGTVLRFAEDINDLFVAQEFRPTTASLNAIELWPTYHTEAQDDLRLYIVEKLTEGDPYCTGFVLTNALVTRAQIVAAAGGTVTARIPVALPVQTGHTYYLLLATETPMDLRAGTTRSGRGYPRWVYDYENAVWREGPLDAPDESSLTVAFNLLNETRGQMRIATDGACDTEPWQAYVLPVPSNLSVTFPNDGWKTAILQYTNSAAPALNGYYRDSILVDTVSPVCTYAAVANVSTSSCKYRLDVLATDAGSGVSTVSWSTDLGSTWTSASYGCTLSGPLDAHEIQQVDVRLTDRAGNVSGVTSVSFPDVFPPELIIQATPAAIKEPTASFYCVAEDHGSGPGIIGLGELRSGTDYGTFPADPDDDGKPESTITVALPKMTLKKEEDPEFVEGPYLFAAWSSDKEGNTTTQCLVQVVYDCTAPVLQSLTVRDGNGGPVANGTNLLLDVCASDNLTAMRTRFRFPGRAWSAWNDLVGGRGTFPLSAPFVAANSYTVQVEVCDAPENTVSGQATIAVNHPPATPGFIYPSGDAAGPCTDFRAAAFSDPDGHTCGATLYEVRKRSRTDWYRSSGSLPGQATFRLAATNQLDLGYSYEWRATQMDEYGLWSAFSSWQIFTPRLDTDGDGLCDLTEKSLGTSLTLADTDGDGIPDADEDFNRNGVVEAGETNPTLADTDSDGISDGSEVAAGTNPLDSSSNFRVVGLMQTNSSLYVIRFRARGGQTYELLSYDQFPAAHTVPVTSKTLRVTGGVSPWYATEAVFTNKATSITSRFYRVQLHP
jgi:hypothetical protein